MVPLWIVLKHSQWVRRAKKNSNPKDVGVARVKARGRYVDFGASGFRKKLASANLNARFRRGIDGARRNHALDYFGEKLSMATNILNDYGEMTYGA